MDKNIRIFHSRFSIDGTSPHGKRGFSTFEGQCTFACRRTTDDTLDVAVSFCHSRDTFRKKEGTRIALQHLESGHFITLPIGRHVAGRVLNDVVREFMSRAGQDDFRHICFGSIPNLPVRDWQYVSFTPRFVAPIAISLHSSEQ